jgi:signal transduction histidine kinase
MEHSKDPASTLNKLLEIVLYIAIGIVAGILADREAERRREVERALARERKTAEQLVRAGRLAALGELVAGVAHEIKNPLHTIRGAAEVVDDIIPKDAEQAKLWALLRREVDRLEEIAERFLGFARPFEPTLERHRFGEVYDRVQELVRTHVRGAGVVIALHVDPLVDAVADFPVRVDRDQIAQVALNLTSNALAALDGSGSLRVAAALREDEDGRFVDLRFENDGPIIPEADLERIFDPFFTRAAGGTGLGLPIAVRIVEAHGGSLEADNLGAERGVAFTIGLPEAL